MFYKIAIVLLLLPATVITALISDRPVNHPPSEQTPRKQLYEWFDSLGYSAALKDEKFVEVDLKADYGGHNAIFGFLREGGEKDYKVLTLGLEEDAVAAGKLVKPPESYVQTATLKFIDPKTWLTEQQALWKKNPPQTFEDVEHTKYYSGLDESASAFVLSRWADLLGYGSLSDFFWGEANTAESWKQEPSKPEERIKNGIADGFLSQAYADITNPRIDRSEAVPKL